MSQWGCAFMWHFQPRVVIFPCPTHCRAHYPCIICILLLFRYYYRNLTCVYMMNVHYPNSCLLSGRTRSSHNFWRRRFEQMVCCWHTHVILFRLVTRLNHSAVFTARCYASAVLAMGLCLSVSVTSRSSTKTDKRRITQTTPHDSPGTLVFWSKDLREIRPGSPPIGAPNAGGVGQNRRLSTNNRLYLENGTRLTHSFY